MHSSRSQALHRSLKLRGHAADMRERHNPAEVALWQQLRAGQLGAWFRRQLVLLGSCIVDFYCPAAKLVVEVDGAYHTVAARRRADARRDRRLGCAGVRVLRLPAHVVLSQPERARALALDALVRRLASRDDAHWVRFARRVRPANHRLHARELATSRVRCSAKGGA